MTWRRIDTRAHAASRPSDDGSADPYRRPPLTASVRSMTRYIRLPGPRGVNPVPPPDQRNPPTAHLRGEPLEIREQLFHPRDGHPQEQRRCSVALVPLRLMELDKPFEPLLQGPDRYLGGQRALRERSSLHRVVQRFLH